MSCAEAFSYSIRGALDAADAHELRASASYHKPEGIPLLFLLCVTDRQFG